ncbi:MULTISPECIES: hypothetical protein [Pseudophaeobacter]|jgi:hypothetical protein|uniref:hypothetical protein n=1 Tax=Pseudophaeobacter TaxID=1541822 RepID=UPI0024321F15|nr:hypothetical protein [Pseudophaeobacter profundi]
MLVQTGLTWFDGSPEGEAQLQSAIDVALWFKAHLSVASVSYIPEFRPSAQYTPERIVLRMQAVKEALDRTRLVFARLDAQDVPGVAFPFVTTRKNFKRQFKGLSRCADIIVQSETLRLIEDRASPFGAQKMTA